MFLLYKGNLDRSCHISVFYSIFSNYYLLINCSVFSSPARQPNFLESWKFWLFIVDKLLMLHKIISYGISKTFTNFLIPPLCLWLCSDVSIWIIYKWIMLVWYIMACGYLLRSNRIWTKGTHLDRGSILGHRGGRIGWRKTQTEEQTWKTGSYEHAMKFNHQPASTIVS